jgi:hypothetical protein
VKFSDISFTGGGPHLDFEKAMEMEHRTDKGCREYFVTNNYKIRTCPYEEWRITVLHDIPTDMSPEATAHNRRFVPIAELMQVDVVIQAELTREEVIAVVLYTGPMVSCPCHVYRPHQPMRPHQHASTSPARHCMLHSSILNDVQKI